MLCKGVWVLHEWTQMNLFDRIFIYQALPRRDEIVLFMKRLITGDAKRIAYINYVQMEKMCPSLWQSAD